MAPQRGYFRLRADIMRDAKYRQLIALAFCFIHSLALGAAPESATEKLRALKLTETALAVADAPPEEWQKLAVSFDQLVAQERSNPGVLAARGDFRWERGEHAGAVADWSAALALDPMEPTALIGLGGAAVAEGDLAKAAALHRKAASARPENPAAHFALANVLFLFRHGLHDAAHPDDESLLLDALSHFEEAARLAPANVEYARAYAETFYSLPNPDWDRARRAWEKVRDVTPTPDFACVNLARVHLKLGQYDTSRDYLRQIQDPAYQRVKGRIEAQLPPPR